MFGPQRVDLDTYWLSNQHTHTHTHSRVWVPLFCWRGPACFNWLDARRQGEEESKHSRLESSIYDWIQRYEVCMTTATCESPAGPPDREGHRILQCSSCSACKAPVAISLAVRKSTADKRCHSVLELNMKALECLVLSTLSFFFVDVGQYLKSSKHA